MAMWIPARRVGGAGPAGDKADTGLSGHLADRLRHHAGSALLAADGDGQIAVMKRIEHRKIALTRYAERMLHAVNKQLIDQNLRRGPHVVFGSH